MTTGQIALQGFNYRVGDGEAKKIVNGQPTEETVALKILTIGDAHSQLQINLIFSAEELEQFIATIDGRRIIAAPMDAFTRNGGFKG